jgi:hypothetical protein
VLFVIGAGTIFLYPTLDAPTPSSWSSADASPEQSSIAQHSPRMPRASATSEGSRLLRSNPLYDAPGIAGRGASSGHISAGPMTWQQPSWGAVPSSQRSELESIARSAESIAYGLRRLRAADIPA